MLFAVFLESIFRFFSREVPTTCFLLIGVGSFLLLPVAKADDEVRCEILLQRGSADELATTLRREMESALVLSRKHIRATGLAYDFTHHGQMDQVAKRHQVMISVYRIAASDSHVANVDIDLALEGSPDRLLASLSDLAKLFGQPPVWVDRTTAIHGPAQANTLSDMASSPVSDHGTSGTTSQSSFLTSSQEEPQWQVVFSESVEIESRRLFSKGGRWQFQKYVVDHWDYSFPDRSSPHRRQFVFLKHKHAIVYVVEQKPESPTVLHVESVAVLSEEEQERFLSAWMKGEDAQNFDMELLFLESESSSVPSSFRLTVPRHLAAKMMFILDPMSSGVPTRLTVVGGVLVDDDDLFSIRMRVDNKDFLATIRIDEKLGFVLSKLEIWERGRAPYQGSLWLVPNFHLFQFGDSRVPKNIPQVARDTWLEKVSKMLPEATLSITDPVRLLVWKEGLQMAVISAALLSQAGVARVLDAVEVQTGRRFAPDVKAQLEKIFADDSPILTFPANRLNRKFEGRELLERLVRKQTVQLVAGSLVSLRPSQTTESSMYVPFAVDEAPRAVNTNLQVSLVKRLDPSRSVVPNLPSDVTIQVRARETSEEFPTQPEELAGKQEVSIFSGDPGDLTEDEIRGVTYPSNGDLSRLMKSKSDFEAHLKRALAAAIPSASVAGEWEGIYNGMYHVSFYRFKIVDILDGVSEKSGSDKSKVIQLTHLEQFGEREEVAFYRRYAELMSLEDLVISYKRGQGSPKIGRQFIDAIEVSPATMAKLRLKHGLGVEQVKGILSLVKQLVMDHTEDRMRRANRHVFPGQGNHSLKTTVVYEGVSYAVYTSPSIAGKVKLKTLYAL